MNKPQKVIIAFLTLLAFLFIFDLKAIPVLAQYGCESSFRCCTSWDVHDNCLAFSSWQGCTGNTQTFCETTYPSNWCTIRGWRLDIGTNACHYSDPVCNCNWSYCFGPGTMCGFPGSWCPNYCWLGEQYYEKCGCLGSSSCWDTGLGSYIPCSNCSFGYGNPYCESNHYELCVESCGGAELTPTPTSPPPTAAPTPTPVPTPMPLPDECTVILTPGSTTSDIGDSTTFTASVTVISGSVDSVDFSSSVLFVATVSPASDNTFPYNTDASSLAPPATTITANVVMSGVIRCSGEATLNVNPASCDITAYDVNLVGVGDKNLTTPITINDISPPPPLYDIDNILFTINLPLIAQVTANPLYPNPDSGAAYRVEMEALAVGNTTYIATATMDDPWATQCLALAGVNVSNPGGWWQVQEGDAVTKGSIGSDIPATCALPSCDPVFITGDPGVPSFGGTINPSPPDVSSTNWNVDSLYSSQDTYDFEFFEKRIPSGATPAIPDSNIITDATELTTEGLYNGYYWNTYDGSATGDFTLGSPVSPVDLGTNKVILFVKNADLIINGQINLTPGRGFFMVIVDGNINIDPSVGGDNSSDTTPELEGFYFADGSFNTGSLGEDSDTVGLHVRGSVVADTVNLDRDLTDNSEIPAELFEYAPELLFFYPQPLTPRRLTWREVAP